MTIDMHSHWKSDALIDAMRARTSPPMIVSGDDGGDVLQAAAGSQPLEQAFDDVGRRLESMNHHGIAIGLLSLQPGFGWIERVAVEQSLPLVRAYNDAMSALCRDHGDRFAAVAALPLTDIAEAAGEFERALALPGIVGAVLPGDGFLTYRNAEAYRPLFEVAQRNRALVFVHRATAPEVPPTRPSRDDDNFTARDSTLDMQASLSSIMITLCLTDLLDPYPDAVVLTHNLGGNIPFEMERLDHRSEERHPGEELPSARIRRSPVVLDCNSFGPRSIERAVEVYGAERIVFGSDGSDFGVAWSLKAVAETRLDDSTRQAILHDNAAAILARLKGIRQAAE